MAKKKSAELDLFDMIDKETVTQETCHHEKEAKTETRWPGYPAWDIRMTYTCLICGRIRGRVK